MQRFTTKLRVRYHEGEEQLLVTAEALWVWVDIQAMRPRAIPRQLLDAFNQANQPDSMQQTLRN